MKKKKEEQVKLPPIDGKKKGKDGAKKKEEYPEHVVIMDAEDIHKAIEGGKTFEFTFVSTPKPKQIRHLYNSQSQQKETT